MPERKRHYVITLQRAGNSFAYTTQDGIYEDDGTASQQRAYADICAEVCRRAAAASGMEWTPDSVGVVFYRLADGP